MARSNLWGQKMGRKGEETRSRLLDALSQLLADTPLRELRAVDITKASGLSPASFYLYFENVETAVLALADKVSREAAYILDVVAQDWSVPGPAIRTFVDAYFDQWDKNGPILRVRNLASDEGDPRFIETRSKIMEPLHKLIVEKIDHAKEQGWIAKSSHSTTLAAVAVASLDRTAATYRSFPRKFGITRERLIEASVIMLRATILGQTTDPE